MPLQTQITYENPESQQLQRRLAAAQTEHEDLRRRTLRARARTTEADAENTAAQALQEILASGEFHHRLAPINYSLNVWCANYDEIATRQREALAATENALRRITQNLARLREQAEQMEHEANYTISKTGLKAILNGATYIPARSVCVGTFGRGGPRHRSRDPFIRWVYSGVTMRPLNNQYTCILDGAIPAIPLLDIVCTINLRTKAISLAPRRHERDLCPKTWGNQGRVHPHILDHDSPCLGDFGGPIAEAITANDWTTVAAIIAMFLETADPADGAGQNWFKFIAPDALATIYTPGGDPTERHLVQLVDGARRYVFVTQDADGNLVTELSTTRHPAPNPEDELTLAEVSPPELPNPFNQWPLDEDTRVLHPLPTPHRDEAEQPANRTPRRGLTNEPPPYAVRFAPAFNGRPR